MKKKKIFNLSCLVHLPIVRSKEPIYHTAYRPYKFIYFEFKYVCICEKYKLFHVAIKYQLRFILSTYFTNITVNINMSQHVSQGFKSLCHLSKIIK